MPIIKKKAKIVDLTGNTFRFGDPRNMTIEKNDILMVGLCGTVII